MKKIKFIRKHQDAKLPIYGSLNSACADIFSAESSIIKSKESKIFNTGLQVAYCHKNYYFTIETRSGMGFKGGLMAHRGIIDSDYRGDVMIKIYNFGNDDYVISTGDRIAQIEIHKKHKIKFEFTDEISKTDRGVGGFGSTGK